MNNFNWAIIGTGFIYPKHKEAIEKNGGQVVAEYNTKNNWEDVLKLDVENVAICTPNDLHFEMAKACLEAGKRVLVEKPPIIGSFLESWNQYNDLEKYDRLFVVLQLRHHPYFEKAKEVIYKNRLDRNRNQVILDIYINRNEDYFKSWKGDKARSGGLIYNIGSHYFDLLTQLFGESFLVFLETLNP